MNKEKKIISLLEDGFSYHTIKKMSNTHIDLLYDRLIKEAESYNTKTKVFDLGNETDRKELDKDANSGGDKQITATDQGDVAITMKNESEISEDDDLAKAVEEPGFNPYDGNSPGNTEGPAGNNPSPDSDGMGIAEEEINEDEVIESLFGKPKSKKKKETVIVRPPITTLGMFEHKEKVRHIEESILSLVNKNKGKVMTKKDVLEEQPSIAPARPTVKPGVKPERGTPYKPKHSPKPKAGTEVKPAQPKVKPGVKPERGTPYKPKHSPKPKASDETEFPEFLKFNNLNIKFSDE
jgi:hypothetical protein